MSTTAAKPASTKSAKPARKAAPRKLTTAPRYNNKSTNYRRRVTDSDNKTLLEKKKLVQELSDLQYMDAFDKEYAPSIQTMGNFNTLSKISRFSLSTSTSTETIFLFIPSTSGIYQTFAWNSAGGLIPQFQANGPIFSLSTEPPLEMRTFRSSVRIRNVTKADNVGGSIQLIQTATPLEIDWASTTSGDITSTYFGELKTMITQSSKSREYSGGEFCTGDKTLIMCPATLDGYQSWKSFNSDSGWSGLQISTNLGQTSMSMQTLMIYLPQNTEVNTYNFTICSQVALRYPVGTILNDLSRTQPSKVKTDEELQQLLYNVQSFSSTFVDRRERDRQSFY